jgi:elongation factor Ts
MEISANLVMELRKKTQCGLMDCKEALVKTKGDLAQAVEYLRKKGAALAREKEGRTTSCGMVASYIHPGNKLGVLIEVGCETDFVANSSEFRSLVKDLAMQVGAANPLYISPEDIPEEVLDKEREIFRAQFINSGKPAKVIENIVEGKLKKFYSEVCLLEQPFIKDPKLKVKGIIAEKVAKLKENIEVKRFTRYQIGK